MFAVCHCKNCFFRVSLLSHPLFLAKVTNPIPCIRHVMPLLCSWMGPSPLHTLGKPFLFEDVWFHLKNCSPIEFLGKWPEEQQLVCSIPLHSSILHPPLLDHGSSPALGFPGTDPLLQFTARPSSPPSIKFPIQALLWARADVLLLLGEFGITAIALRATLSHRCAYSDNYIPLSYPTVIISILRPSGFYIILTL